jgi:hypothetical protein
MKLETLMANVLIAADKVGTQNANSMIDSDEKKLYLKAWKGALLQVALDLGVAFKRMNKKAHNMDVME